VGREPLLDIAIGQLFSGAGRDFRAGSEERSARGGVSDADSGFSLRGRRGPIVARRPDARRADSSPTGWPSGGAASRGVQPVGASGELAAMIHQRRDRRRDRQGLCVGGEAPRVLVSGSPRTLGCSRDRSRACNAQSHGSPRSAFYREGPASPLWTAGIRSMTREGGSWSRDSNIGQPYDQRRALAVTTACSPLCHPRDGGS